MIENDNAYLMLVEDNEDDIELTKRAIESSLNTNKMVIARDGQEASDYLFSEGDYAGQENQLPGLILLDINLPRISGLELLRRIRADQRTKFLPVVVLTVSDEQQDILNSYEFGANSYIRKPINVSEFLDSIKELEIYWMLRNVMPQAK